MGRPPSNGAPSFRFNQVEVTEMDSILRIHNYTVPNTDLLEALAQKFSASFERSGKMEVLGKQVWNWFQNRRYALRAKAARTPDAVQGNVAPVPQTPQPQPYPSTVVGISPQVPHPLPPPSAEGESMNGSDNSSMEFEAKSARDGAWYDITSFRGHRSLGAEDPEVLVRFAGFGPEEDEWVSVCKHVRQRSLPCESSDCVAVLPGDLVLCFQDVKEQALYFNGHVILVDKRRHDARGCRCRFLVRYDHDQSEEIVPLKKVCRRPETDYRLQQLHDEPANATPQKTVSGGNEMKVNLMSQTLQMQPISQENVVGGTPTTQITSE